MFQATEGNRAASKLYSITPVAPILKLNLEDRRFVPGYDVADSLDESLNLASMDWLDFEQLVREIFEKVFATNGGKVKVTQASQTEESTRWHLTPTLYGAARSYSRLSVIQTQSESPR